jgi:hypothetical protein
MSDVAERDFERDGIVSVWIGTRPWNDPEWPDDYCVPSYGEEDDDAPLCAFTFDFRFTYFDLDKTESNYSDDHGLVPLESMLRPLSFSESFLDAALDEARRQGVTEASAAWVIYDFAYDPQVTGVRESRFFRFLGAFPYRPDSAG